MLADMLSQKKVFPALAGMNNPISAAKSGVKIKNESK
jgi:hypothetical protein